MCHINQPFPVLRQEMCHINESFQCADMYRNCVEVCKEYDYSSKHVILTRITKIVGIDNGT